MSLRPIAAPQKPLCLAVGSLRRQLEIGRPHGLLPGVEGAIATTLLDIGLGAPRQEDRPRGLEGNACLVEALGKVAGALRQIAAGIEAATPLPTRCMVGIANALRDHADPHTP
jgi:hypothetical protein